MGVAPQRTTETEVVAEGLTKSEVMAEGLTKSEVVACPKVPFR